jgi:translation elongation factor aEF-1 beta
MASSGIAGIKIKIMPSSPDTNLEEIKNKTKKIVETHGGINRTYEEEPIAFGLKAVIAFFQWPEEKNLEEIEEKIGKIENVNSVQIIDMRKIA